MMFRKKMGYSLLVLAVALTSAELLARLRFTPKGGRGLFEYDRLKVYKMKAAAQVEFSGIQVATNSLGQRDREIPVEKPAGTLRVLVLGDSVTFGVSVSREHTFVEILERELTKQFPHNNIDVINSGVPGYSAFQEYYDLLRALELSPDVVLVQFTLNDLTEPYQGLRRLGGSGTLFPGTEDVTHLPHPLAYVHSKLTESSALYLFFRDLRARIQFRDPTGKHLEEMARQREKFNAGHLVHRSDSPQTRKAWTEYFRWLQRIVDLTREQQIPLILLASPFDFQIHLERSQDVPQFELQRFAERNGITYVDLLSLLRDELALSLEDERPPQPSKELSNPEDSNYQKRQRQVRQFWIEYFLDHDHYNKKGHRFVAEKLLPVVSARLEESSSLATQGASDEFPGTRGTVDSEPR